jgi:hypothetical protein
MTERFADMASTVAHLLEQVVGVGRTGIATPDDLLGLMPFARATRDGSPRDRLNDYARITVDVFDSDYDRGMTAAESIAAFLEPGRLRLGPVLIDRVRIDSAPQEVTPWSPGIFRFEARYLIVSRRHRAA